MCYGPLAACCWLHVQFFCVVCHTCELVSEEVLRMLVHMLRLRGDMRDDGEASSGRQPVAGVQGLAHASGMQLNTLHTHSSMQSAWKW
jgi:hypothetical protein